MSSNQSIKQALLQSYETDGGINHLDGSNLPSQAAVDSLASDFMHLLFPGFFEKQGPTQREVGELVDRRLTHLEKNLRAEIAKCLAFAGQLDARAAAGEATLFCLGELPRIRHLLHTDVSAAYTGDPAARSYQEIILSYPCILAVSLQRVAHVLYGRGIPLLPRMLTEYAHRATGIDIHPGAQIGTHFFIDHGTGVVIGETSTIGNHVKLYQGVGLVAKSFALDPQGHPVKGGKRHPDIEDHVTIYAGATILGGDTRVGAHSIIGASVFLMESVPPHSLVRFEGEKPVIRPRRKREGLEAGPADPLDFSI